MAGVDPDSAQYVIVQRNGEMGVEQRVHNVERSHSVLPEHLEYIGRQSASCPFPTQRGDMRVAALCLGHPVGFGNFPDAIVLQMPKWQVGAHAFSRGTESAEQSLQFVSDFVVRCQARLVP